MTHATAADVRSEIGAMLESVAGNGERIVIQRDGQDVAALVSIDDLAALRELEDQIDREEIREVREEIRREGTVPWEDVKKRLGL